MKKLKSSKKVLNGLWIFIGLAAISIAIGIAIWRTHGTKPSGNPLPPSAEDPKVYKQVTNVVDSTGATNTITVVTSPKDRELPPPAQVVREKRLEPEATKRLATSPKKIKTVLTTTGRAENANWGLGGMGSFVLTYALDCDAKIIEKHETPGGEIKVVEERKFNICRQTLRVYDTDVRFRLYETLPLEEALLVTKFVGGVLTAIPQTAIVGERTTGATILADQYLKKIDGTSARDALKMFGIEVPVLVEEEINKFVTVKVENFLKSVDVEGKCYRITYYQDKDSGSPLRVNLTYADGSQIQSREEFLMLRRANAFLDAQVVPDKNCSPGDTWTIDTSDFECLLDPYVEGAYCGDVTVERKDNDKDGDWMVGLSPCTVTVKSDAGRTTGEINLTSGEAKVDADNVFVKAMVVSGKGGMKNLSPHHLLFNSRFEGDCEFRGVMTTEDLHEETNKNK